MKNKVKLKGQLKTYLQWPMVLSILLIGMNIWMYSIDIPSGIFMSFFTLIYIIIAVVLYLYNKPIIMKELIAFATEYAQVQKQLLQDLAIPYGLIDDSGRFMWMNKELTKLLQKESRSKRPIQYFFSEIPKDFFPMDSECKSIELLYEGRNYRIDFKKLSVTELINAGAMIEMTNPENYLIAVYLYDETEIKQYIKINAEQKMVAGLIYIDNYDEALESVEEVRRSLLTALIDRKINKYISSIDGIVKKMEKDKYFIAFKQKHLPQLQSNKFSLIDDVKTVNIGNEIAVTISIGLGINADTYILNCEYSRTAIDLALGRGGDQAVIKDGDRIYYYGGKSKQVEKNTRVKARVKAHALRELLWSKDRVVVMGHKIGDVDSLGAAIGLYRASKMLDKKVYIVINEITTSLRPMIERFIKSPEYEEDMFITSAQAVDVVDMNTALVVVDVSRPSFTECPELLQKTKAIIVLDHHRQSTEIIDNAVLSYIEPYASSTCEMVAEILQYIGNGVKLRQPEADALYAGIIIDTDNFANKAGVRTFEAAAFLRRNGADVTRVRKMFRNDMADYKARAEAVRHAEVFENSFAIAVCPADQVESPTIVGAQAANELLNITGIRASFVITEFNNKIYISARSIDEINVQLVMERLGGGGHSNIAGAQLENYSIQDAKQLIKDTLKQMLTEGDL